MSGHLRGHPRRLARVVVGVLPARGIVGGLQVGRQCGAMAGGCCSRLDVTVWAMVDGMGNAACVGWTRDPYSTLVRRGSGTDGRKAGSSPM